MRRGLLVGAVAVVLLAAALLGGWLLRGDEAAAAPSAPIDVQGVGPLPETVAAALHAGQPVLTWAAHTAAAFEPCGCAAGMYGGLLRRASLLDRVDDAVALDLECGGWAAGSAPHHILRTRHYRAALADAGIDACGVGAAELALGADVLAELAAVGPPLVCANLDGLAPEHCRPRLDLRIAGQDFVVTSIAPPVTPGPGLSLRPAADALLAIIDELTSEQRLVVMADLDAEGLRELAASVPGIDAVVGGAVHQPSKRPVRVGGTRVVFAGNEGKTLGWWPWQDAACAFELIVDTLPDAAGPRAHLTRYQEALATRRFPSDDVPVAADAPRYVGPQVCADCHTSAAAVHEASRHPHALESLVHNGYAYDPDCLACHVTANGRPDAFRRLEQGPKAFARVGCESCHGPGSEHVAARRAGRADSGSLRVVTPATCVGCHDQLNSPHFDHPVYWERIRHGLDPQ